MRWNGLDEDGFTEREGGLDRVQQAFAPVVAAARTAIPAAFAGDRLHSAYLYGSVPRGTAVPGGWRRSTSPSTGGRHPGRKPGWLKRSGAPAPGGELAGAPLPGQVYGRRMEVAELAHLRRARDLLDREYARPLDVPAMARAALMSPSLFSRRFREAYGETPYAYLQARRVERAMALLRRGMSVTDACMAVGFTSLGSFSSTFARLIGEPPSAYRARDHSRLAPVPPCMTRAWARPGWIAEPCRIGEAVTASPG